VIKVEILAKPNPPKARQTPKGPLFPKLSRKLRFLYIRVGFIVSFVLQKEILKFRE
jgi:hypothetical protein